MQIAKSPNTRDRLLRATSELFSLQGYSGTGLKAVVGRAGVSLGSLYHFFPNGKSQLGAEAILEAGGRVERGMVSRLKDQPDAASGLNALFDAEAAHLEATSFEGGCPAAGAALDASCESEEIRLACAEVFARWRRVLEEAFNGWGHDADSAEAYAQLSLSSLEGAILVSRAEGSTTALRRTQAALAALFEPGRTPAVVRPAP